MHRSILLLALTANACASDRPAFGDGPPPWVGHDGGEAGPGRPAGGPAHLFISPMGEPFRVDRPEQAWFAASDTNGDGRMTPAEFTADAARFFKRLDRQADGEIDPDDVAVYENELVPEIHVSVGGGPGGGPPGGGRGRGPGGGGRPPGGGGGPPGGGGGGGPAGGGERPNAGPGGGGVPSGSRFSYLALPEPVTAADANFNRGIDWREFERAADQRFAILDRNGDGVLTPRELPPVDTRVRGGMRGRPPGPPPGGWQGQRSAPREEE